MTTERTNIKVPIEIKQKIESLKLPGEAYWQTVNRIIEENQELKTTYTVVQEINTKLDKLIN